MLAAHLHEAGSLVPRPTCNNVITKPGFTAGPEPTGTAANTPPSRPERQMFKNLQVAADML